MKFSEAEPTIVDGIAGWAKLKGIDLDKDRTEEQWSVFFMIALQHINRRTD